MTQPALHKDSKPSLAAVDRATAELRRGAVVVVEAPDGRKLAVLAVETADRSGLEGLKALGQGAVELTLTHRRAEVLHIRSHGEGSVVALSSPSGLDMDTLTALADPCAASPAALSTSLEARSVPRGDLRETAILLVKLARLLPAVVVVEIDSVIGDCLVVGEDDIRAYDGEAARSLQPVSEARVPLHGAENAKVVAFRPADGGVEHLAIIIGDIDVRQPVLVRLHSECFTGDLLGSLRCDCGDQLKGAIAEIGQAGSGVLLYLAQEGRGIGLVNKLRAYQLQDRGFDTLDANGQLGFDEDERIYLPAAEMLTKLHISSVRLLTNNPLKVEALARHGVAVVERVRHVFPANGHNSAYLHTKATKGGHLF